MFLTIVVFLLVLSVLVFVHELGHFATARWFGVKPREFGFGFPPRVWGVYKDQAGKWKQTRGAGEVKDAADTIYSINAIPLGGFVNIGEDDINDSGPNSFVGKKIWQRAIILSAGVTMNIVLAMVIIILGLMFGMPQALDGLSPKAKISNQQIQIMQVIAGSPAEIAGVKAGDIIVDIDGQKFARYTDLQKYADDNVGKELSYNLKRYDQEIVKNIIPQKMDETKKGGIGIAIAETGIVKYPWYLAIWEGSKATIYLTWAIIVAFFNLFKDLFTGHGVSADLAGPIGIATMTGQVARMGFVYLLQFTALLSINLAIINFLPIPALDGGRVIFLLIEKIKGSPVKREVEAAIHNICFIGLMILVLFVTVKDVSNLQIFKVLWQKIISLN